MPNTHKSIEEIMSLSERVCEAYEQAAPPNDNGEALQIYLTSRDRLRTGIIEYAQQQVQEAVEEMYLRATEQRQGYAELNLPINVSEIQVIRVYAREHDIDLSTLKSKTLEDNK